MPKEQKKKIDGNFVCFTHKELRKQKAPDLAEALKRSRVLYDFLFFKMPLRLERS